MQVSSSLEHYITFCFNIANIEVKNVQTVQEYNNDSGDQKYNIVIPWNNIGFIY